MAPSGTRRGMSACLSCPGPSYIPQEPPENTSLNGPYHRVKSSDHKSPTIRSYRPRYLALPVPTHFLVFSTCLSARIYC